MIIETRWTEFLQGSTRFDLVHDGQSLSHLEGVVPLILRFGLAEVRADSIAGLGTAEEYRRLGYARRVMEAALEHMGNGEAAISFLHGIPDFYHRFGYITAGPSYEVSIGVAVNANFPKPQNYTARSGTQDDLPAIQTLYQANSCGVMGAAVRPPDGLVWRKLTSSLLAGECRVVEDRQGKVTGYAWLALDCWAVRAFASGRDENAFVIGEVMAADQGSAAAVIAVCREWAEEEGKRRGVPIYQVNVPLPPAGPVAATLRFQNSIAQQRYKPNSGFMARVLNVKLLIKALAPELKARVQGSGLAFSGVLTLHTDIGDATLAFGNDSANQKMAVSIDLPQATLIRLIFGAVTARDILDHDRVIVSDLAHELLEVLFPLTCPHVYLPDQC